MRAEAAAPHRFDAARRYAWIACPAVVVPGLIAAFWPVWRWYVARVTDGSDEPWGLLALATAALLVPGRGWLTALPSTRLCAGGAFLTLYAVAWPLLPALVRAALAMATLACGLPFDRDRSAAPRVVLLLISLPIIASLQFYLGFPLRALTAWAAAHTLTATGFAVEAHGTVLTWAGEEVLVDTPCSGIRMLWTALYLATTLAAVHRLPPRRFARLLQATGAAVFVGNLARTVLLFFPEAHLWPNPARLHESIGLACFLAVVVVLLLVARRLRAGLPVGAHAVATPLSPDRPARPWDRAVWQRTPVVILWSVTLIAGLRPLHVQAAALQPDPASESTVWPAEFEGAMLTPAALHAAEERLARDFPGRIAAFQDGPRRIIMRSVTQATRKVHAIETCLRAGGFGVRPAPAVRHPRSGLWGVLRAEKAGCAYRVRERIVGADGARVWTDVSAWYWSALLNPHAGPWLVVTVIEPESALSNTARR